MIMIMAMPGPDERRDIRVPTKRLQCQACGRRHLYLHHAEEHGDDYDHDDDDDVDDGDDDHDHDHNDTLDLFRATAYRWRLLTFTVPLSMFQKVSQD